MADEWDIAVGEVLRRTEVHARYGGGGQGGMEPSGQTPNVLLFTGDDAGTRWGYPFDGWSTDGTFHYTGEGSIGPQVMTFGNKAVRDHVEQGRALRLFEKQGDTPFVRYIGEFELPDSEAWTESDALGTDKVIRSVFVFRLQPVGTAWGSDTPTQIKETAPQLVALEANDVEQYEAERPAEPQQYLRREAALVARYAAWLAQRGCSRVQRHRIPTVAGPSMYTDLFDHSRKLLIEAKASGTRQDIRAAFGQVLDYARYVDHEYVAILLPTEPPADMEELLAFYAVGVIWETSKGVFEEHLAGPH